MDKENVKIAKQSNKEIGKQFQGDGRTLIGSARWAEGGEMGWSLAQCKHVISAI